MPMCNLIEYTDNYAKISANLSQYYRDESNILANSESFNSKIKITGKPLMIVMKKMLKQWLR